MPPLRLSPLRYPPRWFPPGMRSRSSSQSRRCARSLRRGRPAPPPWWGAFLSPLQQRDSRVCSHSRTCRSSSRGRGMWPPPPCPPCGTPLRLWQTSPQDSPPSSSSRDRRWGSSLEGSSSSNRGRGSRFSSSSSRGESRSRAARRGRGNSSHHRRPSRRRSPTISPLPRCRRTLPFHRLPPPPLYRPLYSLPLLRNPPRRTLQLGWQGCVARGRQNRRGMGPGAQSRCVGVTPP